jgi:hypothetical protein
MGRLNGARRSGARSEAWRLGIGVQWQRRRSSIWIRAIPPAESQSRAIKVGHKPKREETMIWVVVLRTLERGLVCLGPRRQNVDVSDISLRLVMK